MEMVMPLFRLAAAGMLALAAFPALAEERVFNLPAFDRVDVSAGIKVNITAGEPQNVVVKTVNGNFEDLEIEVRDGALHLSREWNRLRWHGKKTDYLVTISVDTLRGIEASSGSNADLLNVDTRALNIDISSGAFASVAGASDECVIDISSGGNLEAKNLTCNAIAVDVSSGGRGAVSVREAVNGDASSGGHVAVYGAPSLINIDRSSGGRIVVKPTAQARRD